MAEGSSMTRSKDLLTGLTTIALAVFLFVVSNNVKDFASVGVGAGFLPRLTAYLLGILGLILSIEGWRRRISAAPKAKFPPAPAVGKTADEVEVFGGWPAVLLSIALMCAYVGFLERLGFILASSIYAFGQMLILAKNVKWKLPLFGTIAVVSSALTYFLFVRLFQVMLPPGLLG